MVGLFNYPKRRLKKLVYEGEYKEALEFGQSLKAKYSNDIDFLFIMGSIYYMLGDAKNSLNYFNKILEIDENETETLLYKANVHLYLKENQEAKNCCNKILQLEPNNKDAREILDKLEEN